MDNEKINGIPEEETEAEVNEVQETETTEEVNETVQENAEDTVCEDAEESEEETPENTEEEVPAEEEEEEISEDELCECCGEKRKLEDSDYCSDCEATMLSRKIPFLGWISGLVVIVISVFALALATLVAAPSIKVSRGDSFARDNCWYSAYREYTEVNSVIFELTSILGQESPFIKMGTGLTYKVIDTVAKTSSPLDAITVADSLLGANSTENDRVLNKKYGKLKSDYMSTFNEIKATYNVMQYGEASYETTKASLEKARGKEGVNDILLDYFIFTATLYYNRDVEESLEVLDRIDKAAKESKEDYTWLYYQDYADNLFEAGQNEKALEYIDAIIENDKTKFGAYELKVRIALSNNDIDEANRTLEEFKKHNEGYDTAYVLEATLLRVSGKYEEAKVLLTDAIEEYSSVPELHRQRALLYLIEGNIDEAYKAADEAVYNALYLYSYMNDSSAVTPQLINTAYLCSYLADKTGASVAGQSMWMPQLLEGMTDQDLPQRVRDAINGKYTWEEVLTEGECDLL